MRHFLTALLAFSIPISAHAQGMTPAQEAVMPIVGKYLDCGYIESTMYAIQLPDETPENIHIAMMQKCKEDYTTGKQALEANFTAVEAQNIIATVEDEFMRRVVGNVVETRMQVVRAKSGQ